MDENILASHSLSVSETNHLIRTLIKESFYNISIVGEVSTFRPSANGHWYFKLKDEKSQLDAVMFRSAAAIAPFTPKDGDFVEVHGSIDVYEPRGSYQIVVQRITLAGVGQLLAQIQKRKEYYQSLGWFEAEGKLPIPPYPTNIGIVTATTGAAVRDMLDTTRRRAPSVDITIYPTLVQGREAASQIAAAIAHANALGISDVLIVGRGGGSVEDLLPFSEDEVIKAIHDSSIPVISAVGHEIDTALSDYVASRRAITPTDGASIATEGIWALRQNLAKLPQELSSLMEARTGKLSASLPSLDELGRTMRSRTGSLEMRLGYASDLARQALDSKLEDAQRRLGQCAERMEGVLGTKAAQTIGEVSRLWMEGCHAMDAALGRAQSRLERATVDEDLIMGRIGALTQRIASNWQTLSLLMAHRIGTASLSLEALRSPLEALDPRAVLKRGYAMVKREDGTIVRCAKDLGGHETMTISFADGSVRARRLED